MMIKLPENKKLVLFDGVCNLCNSSVQFIIKRDKKGLFLFTPLQGITGQELVSEYQIDITKTDSIILYFPEKGLFYKSSAALEIAANLKFPYNLLKVLIIIPKSIRDWVYDFVAKHRYKWFGKKEACMIPTLDLKSRFLD